MKSSAVHRYRRGTSGDSGTTLKSKGNSRPTSREMCGAGGTRVTPQVPVVPLVPPCPGYVGPGNPNEINAVPRAPHGPHDLGKRLEISDILRDAARRLSGSKPCLDIDVVAAFEERAAILEFDAGLPRSEAEDLAARDVGFTDAAHYRAELSATMPMIGAEYGTA